MLQTSFERTLPHGEPWSLGFPLPLDLLKKKNEAQPQDPELVQIWGC